MWSSELHNAAFWFQLKAKTGTTLALAINFGNISKTERKDYGLPY
jgi:hypothetical protein